MIAEQTLDKEEIFEYYVNHIWFGSGYNTRGIQKAAKYFFNKDVSQLNLGEAAFLAGAINAPDTYNPLNNLIKTDQDYLANATERRNTTLALMLQHGYITETFRMVFFQKGASVLVRSGVGLCPGVLFRIHWILSGTGRKCLCK